MRKIYSDFDYLLIPEGLTKDENYCYVEYAQEMARDVLLGAVMSTLGKGPLIAYGYLDLWDGNHYIARKIDSYEKFLETMYGCGTCDVSCTVYIDDDDELIIESSHHDGTNRMCIRQLTVAGRKTIENVVDLESAKRVFENKTYKKPFGLVLEKYL